VELRRLCAVFLFIANSVLLAKSMADMEASQRRVNEVYLISILLTVRTEPR
jgi:hypothetical protein